MARAEEKGKKVKEKDMNFDECKMKNFKFGSKYSYNIEE